MVGEELFEKAIPHTGILILDVLIICLVALAVASVCLLALWHKARPWLADIRADTKVVREHAENSHAGTPHPNLRDNIDANQTELRTGIAALMNQLGAMQKAQQEVQRDIGGLREELRGDRAAQRETARALAEHIRDKASMEPRLAAVEHQLEQHRQATEA